MKNVILITVVFFASFSMLAQEKKSKNAKYTIEVKGVCEDCKKRIENAAFSISGVKSAVWNSEENSLNLIVNEQKTSINKVEMKMAEIGHDTGKFKALESDYQSLPKCCQYER
jgi:copper chaperone CopZ